MLKTNGANNEMNNLGIKKVGHLYENIKFACSDDVNQINSDFRSDYLEIIKSAASGNYDELNQLINDTFNADVKVLENKLKDSKDISQDAKKKFFFNGEKGKIMGDFIDYIRIIYAERVLFDILNIGLKDLESNSIKEILQSKQEARIHNFIISMTDDKNNNGMFDSNFKIDFSERAQDKKNFLRYVIYFHYLAASCSFVRSQTEKLKKINDQMGKGFQNEIEENNKSIKENENSLNKLREEIETLQNQINQSRERLDNQANQLKIYDAKTKKEIERTLQRKQQEQVLKTTESNKIKEKTEKLTKTKEYLDFILQNYDDELKLAQNILNDIQNSWKMAFHNFIFLYMLENPDQITKLKEIYKLSIWDFMSFLLDHEKHQNFNRALYEIDKTKNSKDFEDEADKKRTEILKSDKNSINRFDENQRKLVNDLFKSDHLKNLFMSNASRILRRSIFLFIVIATLPLLVIVVVNIAILLADFVLGVLAVLASLFVAALDCAFSPDEASETGGLLVRGLWRSVPWVSFRSFPIITPYYCSTVFFVAIGITAAFLIGAIAFYIYKRMQFNSIIKVPNLQIQQKKSPLESQLENFKNKLANSQEQTPNNEKENLAIS